MHTTEEFKELKIMVQKKMKMYKESEVYSLSQDEKQVANYIAMAQFKGEIESLQETMRSVLNKLNM